MMNNYTLGPNTNQTDQSTINVKALIKKQITIWEQILAHKLGYEWKNLFRMLIQLDKKQTNRIELQTFDEVCQQFKIHVSPDELNKIRKHYCDVIELEKPASNDNEAYLLRYTDLSVGLHLHKDSFNHMRNTIMFGVSQPKYDLSMFSKQKKSCVMSDDEKSDHDDNVEVKLEDCLPAKLKEANRSTKNILKDTYNSKLVDKLKQKMMQTAIERTMAEKQEQMLA